MTVTHWARHWCQAQCTMGPLVPHQLCRPLLRPTLSGEEFGAPRGPVMCPKSQRQPVEEVDGNHAFLISHLGLLGSQGMLGKREAWCWWDLEQTQDLELLPSSHCFLDSFLHGSGSQPLQRHPLPSHGVTWTDDGRLAVQFMAPGHRGNLHFPHTFAGRLGPCDEMLTKRMLVEVMQATSRPLLRQF